jgi:iron complex outermembrane receptor protein
MTTNATTGQYQQTAFSPKRRLVYRLLGDKIMAFGNYNTGFQNVAPVNQPDGTVSTFKPQYANQIEGGIKVELPGELLSATVSYYHIKVRNTLRPDVTRQNFTIQDGTQASQGIEIDLSSRPLSGMFLNAGFAYNNSRLLSAPPAVNALRPVNSGPDRTVNFYVSYQLPGQTLQGLGAGFGGNYVGRNLIINNTVNGQFYLDSYTLLNLGLFYRHQRYRFAVNVDNLTNKYYYYGGFGSITPATPRRYIATLALTF